MLALALGGEGDEVELCELEPQASNGDGILEFALPTDVWSRMRTNLGYWWAVFGLSSEDPNRVLRTSEIRCVVRHEDIARVPESTLRYSDQGHLPVVDLGGNKRGGWEERSALPERPKLEPRKHPFSVPRANHVEPEQAPAGDEAREGGMTKEQYRRLIEGVRTMVAETLPADATIVVASKGDDAILALDLQRGMAFSI